MSDENTRTKRLQDIRRKRNELAREILDRTGPYKPKVRDARKGEYKRNKNKPRVNTIHEFDDE